MERPAAEAYISHRNPVSVSANWEQYQTLLTQIGDTAAYRVTYLDGILEIKSPSRRHEISKSRIGNLLEIYFVEAGL